MVARWKPVHNGHAVALAALGEAARDVVIGIGSSNRYDVRNPFTADETEDMLRAALMGRAGYTLKRVADLDDGPRWRELVVGLFGPLDAFVTDNPYVAHLLEGDYEVIRPVALVPPERRVAVDGTSVRRALALGDGWRELVPGAVREYIVARGLDRRFREEFGLETLALQAVT